MNFIKDAYNKLFLHNKNRFQNIHYEYYIKSFDACKMFKSNSISRINLLAKKTKKLTKLRQYNFELKL